jgi:hypothetical protein
VLAAIDQLLIMSLTSIGNLKLNKKGKVIILCILAVLVIVLYLKDIKDKNRLENNGKLVSGVVESTSYTTRTGCYVKYSFTVGNTMFEGESRVAIQYSHSKILLHRSFPVLYHKDDPSISSILITREDFKYYNLNFPDSLSWVSAQQNLW